MCSHLSLIHFPFFKDMVLNDVDRGLHDCLPLFLLCTNIQTCSGIPLQVDDSDRDARRHAASKQNFYCLQSRPPFVVFCGLSNLGLLLRAW